MANTSPPSWTLSGFHARVRMSKSFRLFIVAEGVETDPYFYDSIAKSSQLTAVKACKVYPVAQVTRPPGGKPGNLGDPGKKFVVEAYLETKSKNSLAFENSSGRNSIIFCVDRDLDATHEIYENDRHFCVTQQRDAESEIFQNADFVEAIKILTSSDHVDAMSIAKKTGNWQVSLTRIWKEWILLAAVAISLPSAPPGVSWGGVSLINVPLFGDVDTAKKSIFESKLISKLGSPNKLRKSKTDARKRLEDLRSRFGVSVLVKGKWYPAYLDYLLHSQGVTKNGKVAASALAVFCGVLDFRKEWADFYRCKFEEALRSD